MSASKARLLLVDDDPSAIQIMSRMLGAYPDQRFATSGVDALRLARESAPDLILLDADMPGMTGLDVCDALKADPALAQVPIIFATSHHAPLLEAAVLERGAADFVNKPLVASQLNARVRVQLRARSLNRRRLANRGAEPRAVAPASEPRPARLLLVDDDVAAIRILRHALADLGEFHFAKTGEEGLALARRIAPDLVLLDGHMPGRDGYAVCEALKQDPAFEHVPVVMVTRFSDPRNERRAFDLGASDFIAKPYSQVVVHARVRNLLELKRRAESQLQEADERWRAVSDARITDIVNAASDAIVSHDAEGRVVLANASACRLLDRPLGELLGRPIQDLFGASPEAAPTHRPARLLLPRPGDAGPVAVELAWSAVGEGGARLTTVILRDVAERERFEAESRARAAAEAANQTKTLMLSYVAHEMINPLNGLLGFAQLMAVDPTHPLAPAQARRLEHVSACGRQLQVLMRDLLDFGGLESGRLAVDLRPVELDAAVRAAASAVAAQASQASIAVHAPALAPAVAALGDPARLHQCLLNLLSNAVKYNRPGGWVLIDVIEHPGQIEIAVRDNGLGMDADQRAHLFEPFNRLGRQGAAPGAGLGLMVTRLLVEAMNGQLRVDSEPGQGSCFAMTLPRHGPTTGPVGIAPAHPH